MRDAVTKAYYQVLQQKQETLPRLAGRLGAAELEKAYLGLSKAKQSFLGTVVPSLTSKDIAEHALLFCASLPGILRPSFYEVTQFAVHHAVDDIHGKEASLISDVDSLPREISRVPLEMSLKAASSESKVELLISFASRLAEALKVGVQEFNGVGIDECVSMIGRRIDSFLSNLRRIVFTELCSAYNFTQLLCYDEIFSDESKFKLRWCERINDQTGKPMTGSVSEDSIAMHGQVAKPQEYFYGPDGGRWFHPPNRPYDHAVLMFWHPNLKDVPVWTHNPKGSKNASRA